MTATYVVNAHVRVLMQVGKVLCQARQYSGQVKERRCTPAVQI
jgi:hypothetical protein